MISILGARYCRLFKFKISITINLFVEPNTPDFFSFSLNSQLEIERAAIDVLDRGARSVSSNVLHD